MGFCSLVRVLRYHHATVKPPATAATNENSPTRRTLAPGLSLNSESLYLLLLNNVTLSPLTADYPRS